LIVITVDYDLTRKHDRHKVASLTNHERDGVAS